MKPATPAGAPGVKTLAEAQADAAGATGATGATGAVAAGRAKFVPKKIKTVSVTVLRQVDETAMFVMFTTPPFLGKEIKGSRMAAARIAYVLNLETGEVQQMIMNSVLESALGEAYPKWTWVGRSFSITPHKPDEGRSKRYRTYSIDEIETPEGIPAAGAFVYDPALDATLKLPTPAAG